MTINEYLEYWDNQELDDYEWGEQMRQAVADYNNEYGTVYDLDRAVQSYKSWKRQNQEMEM
jgi:hypothetical protein